MSKLIATVCDECETVILCPPEEATEPHVGWIEFAAGKHLCRECYFFWQKKNKPAGEQQ